MYFFKKELPNCEHCGTVVDRDVNVAINIETGRWGIPSLSLVESDGVPGLLREKPTP
jgi:transposase